MSIIYSYPEQAPLNLNDMLIGTSSVKVGGKQKNITRNFSLKQIADFIGEGGAVFNPTASDFQIGVFNQGGTKLTGSIMSQDTFPNGTGITVAGNLTTTNNLTALGDVVLGNQQLTNNIKLLSETYLSGQIRDIGGNLGNTDQILISNNIGFVSWTDYKAGLVYQGVWNATTGRTTPDNILLQSGIGQNGQFYIVTVAGNYQLDGNPASPESPPYWQIGDWVIFVSKGNTNEWQKIDNTSALTGTGTDNKIAMWTGGATPSVTLTDSIISQAAGGLAPSTDPADTLSGLFTNTNASPYDIGAIGSNFAENLFSTLNLTQFTAGDQVEISNGTSSFRLTLVTQGTVLGGVNGTVISGTQTGFAVNGLTGTITLLVAVTGGITIAGTVIPTTITDKDTLVGTAGQILSSTATGIEWIDNQVGTVTGTGTTNTLPIWFNGASGTLGDSILNQAAAAGVFTDTHLSIQGSGGLSTQNLEINKALYDGAAAPGTDGQVLTSSTQGADQEVRWVNASTIGDTYTLSAGAISGSSVPLNLVATTGTDSLVNLTGGTGITLTQTSANEITIEGSAQGVTGSGTSGKLPKFDTATSLNDSIVTQSGGTTTITPLINNVISFNPQTSSFTMANYATNNTVTGPAPQVGDVLNFVLISDLTWATGGGVIPAGTYPYTVTTTGSGLSCNFNSYTIPASTSGYGYTNMLGNGSSTGTNAIDVLAIDGELSMVTHQIKNVVNPTDAQDAATKNYVDSIPRGVMTFGTSDSGATITVSGGAPDPRVKANTAAVTAASTSLATGAQIQTAINNSVGDYLPLSGGTMTGEIDMGSDKIINVTNPTLAQDAATKSYVDTTAAGSGALVYQTGYNAITNSPDLTTGGTGVLQGFTYAVTAGPSTTFWSPPLEVGDLLIANVDNPTTIADWTEIQSNIGAAGSGATDAATVKGVSGFNSDDFDVSITGWVQAKDFTGSTPGYVPNATSATAGTFLKEDGTWSAIAPTAGVGSYTTGNGTILSPQTTSVQLAISATSMSGSVFNFVNGLSLGDLVQITDGTVNGFFTYSIAGGGPNGYRFAYVSGEIPTNFSTNANAINLRNASAGVIGDISGSGNGSSVTYFTGIIGDTGVKEITSNPNIVIDSTGKFGIGTDQPNHDLDVRNLISQPIINLQDNNLSYLQLQVDPLLTTTNKIKSNIDLVLDVDGYEAIKIDTAANVMIGDLNNTYGSATSRLHVIEEFGTDILTLQSNTTNQKIKFTDYNQPSNDCFIGSDNGNLNVWLDFAGVSTPLFNFNKDGKLGVGTASPNYTVDIQDLNFDANLQLFSQNTGQNLILSASSSFGQDNTIDSGSGALQFRTNNSNILNLGTGTQQGYVNFNEYGQGNKTGSGGIGVPTYSLLVDSVGEIIEGPVSSGGGTPVITKESFSPSAGQTQYNLNPLGVNNPQDENYVNIYIDGVYQNLNTISSVITSGTGAAASTTVTMVSGAPAGVTVEIVATT